MIPDEFGRALREMDNKFVFGFTEAFVDNDKERLSELIDKRRPGCGITWNKKQSI